MPTLFRGQSPSAISFSLHLSQRQSLLVAPLLPPVEAAASQRGVLCLEPAEGVSLLFGGRNLLSEEAGWPSLLLQTHLH